MCEDIKIENVWISKYLGSRFRADDRQVDDIKTRIGATTSATGKMCAIWTRQSTPLSLKMRIYNCSRLTYGSETWCLDSHTHKMLNGVNSRLVSRITNRSPHEEVRVKTQTFDIVRWIRVRRLKWVGHMHILRMVPERMVNQSLRHIAENTTDGDLLMAVPPAMTWTELQALVTNRDGWRQRVHNLRYGPKIEITMNDALPGCKATPRNIDHHLPLKSETAGLATSQKIYCQRRPRSLFPTTRKWDAQTVSPTASQEEA